MVRLQLPPECVSSSLQSLYVNIFKCLVCNHFKKQKKQGQSWEQYKTKLEKRGARGRKKKSLLVSVLYTYAYGATFIMGHEKRRRADAWNETLTCSRPPVLPPPHSLARSFSNIDSCCRVVGPNMKLSSSSFRCTWTLHSPYHMNLLGLLFYLPLEVERNKSSCFLVHWTVIRVKRRRGKKKLLFHGSPCVYDRWNNDERPWIIVQNNG